MKFIATILLLTSTQAVAQFDDPLVLDPHIPGLSSKILVHDINNDDNDDIAVTRAVSFGVREVVIYSGDGLGGFSLPQLLTPNGHSPWGLSFGDLDGDGWDDMVSTSLRQGDGLVWFPSNSGSFSTMITIDEEFHRFSDSRIIDADNDGDLDILVIGDVVFALYTNDGSGVFTKTIIPPVVITENYSFDVADINNDGFVDVVIGGVDTFIYINNTDNTFTYDPVISDSFQDAPSLIFLVHARDFDGDGDQDMIVGDTNLRNYWWFEQQNDGLFALRQILSTTIPPSFSLVSADFDNDGNLDLLSNYTQQGQTVWFKGHGSNDFESADIVHQGASPNPSQVATGDFNNDGFADAVWAYPLSVSLSIATTPDCPADLTNDGILDLADISAFISAFVAQDTLADFTSDGVFDLADISAYLQAFTAGCP